MSTVSLGRMKALGVGAFATPSLILKLAVLAILMALVVGPLSKILLDTLTPDTIGAWSEVLSGRLAPNLFYKPLTTTIILGIGTAIGCVVLGGYMAWLVVMTTVPFRKTLGFLSTLPFMIPSFATALAWGVLFRNDRVGGQVGFLQGLGLDIPDWLAWGIVPTLIVLIAHYYSLAFTVIAAALATVNSDLVEAGTLAGASKKRILFGIVLPVALPAVVAGASLTFAGAVSNFAAPALLGLPVRMQTLSTRIFGMVEVGQVERAYVIAILLILVSAAFLWFGTKIISGRRSYATITGKGGRSKKLDLGVGTWPFFTLAVVICTLTTIVPVITLVASSFAPASSELFSNWTLHYWIGVSNPAYLQGLPGVLHNPEIVQASGVSIGLGLMVAVTGTLVGVLIAYTLARHRTGFLSGVINQIAFLPLLVPGLAFGAAYITYLGAPIGPFPGLYGTFAMLVVAGTAYLLPFSVQTGRAVLQQVSGELEECARMTGANFVQRFAAIMVPLAVRGMSAGALLIFVKIVRDLSLVVLLFTPTMPVLTVVAFRYASEGFAQPANAITVVIMTISIVATLIANRLQSKSQPWLSD